MERRVQQTEHDRLAVHHAERVLDGGLHEGLELGQGGLALLVGVAEDHLAELGQREFAVAAVEHVLDAEQADALGAELEGAGGVLRGVGVGADTELAVLVAHAHELGEERVLGGIHRVDGAAVDETLGAVQAQEVTLLEGLVDAGEGDGLVLEVDLEGVAAHDAALAPAAGQRGRSCRRAR